jgi:beta-galactosidase
MGRHWREKQPGHPHAALYQRRVDVDGVGLCVRATRQPPPLYSAPLSHASTSRNPTQTPTDKGEPTPYSWPDINSHFGILDIAGFEKDRFWWYAAWFIPSKPLTFVLPHWNWNAGDNYPIWVYSNAAEVELFVNDVSQGRKPSPQYGHVEFAAPFSPGSLRAVGYATPGATMPASSALVNTTGAPAALAISVKDGVGATLLAGCSDVALVQVFVVDKNGLVVPTANNTITFAVTGPAKLGGTGNGDPACHTNDKDPARPAFHGKVLAVVLGGSTEGQVQVTASADGFDPVTVTIQQQAPQSVAPTWCYANNPRL